MHPGYGFLSENPEFADNVTSAGLRFIGPSGASIRLLGDKTAARGLAASLGIPMIAGSGGALDNEETAAAIAAEIGFPVLLKAAAGGGGKGMRIVEGKKDFSQAFSMARSEAKNAFGDERIYVEKYVKNPHHVEIQILGDHYGSMVYFGERDCSIQRRHQKVIEESPSTIISEATRRKMGESAVNLAKKAGYSNAGTVEFLVDNDGDFFFLEVNTRLQVEHPVTEAVSGIDLVRAQIRVAQGDRLEISQQDIHSRGHAVECRIYAEDPSNDFFPSTGRLDRYRLPSGPRIRIDNGAQEGDTVQIYYDPMLAKIVSWGPTRGEAIAAMKRALSEYEITGIQSTIPFCQYVLGHTVFVDGKHDTGFVNQYFRAKYLNAALTPSDHLVAALAAALLVDSSQQSILHENGSGQTGSSWKARRAEAHR